MGRSLFGFYQIRARYWQMCDRVLSILRDRPGKGAIGDTIWNRGYESGCETLPCPKNGKSCDFDRRYEPY